MISTYSLRLPVSLGHTITAEFSAGKPQLFVVTAMRSYLRRDGQASAIITWSSVCTTCHRVYTFERGLAGKFDVRRCEACRRKRVRNLFKAGRPSGRLGREK